MYPMIISNAMVVKLTSTIVFPYLIPILIKNTKVEWQLANFADPLKRRLVTVNLVATHIVAVRLVSVLVRRLGVIVNQLLVPSFHPLMYVPKRCWVN